MSRSHDEGCANCRDVFDLLSDYVDGELTPETREALDRHLEACPPCEQFLETFRATQDLCRESLAGEMPEELRGRLRSFLRTHLRKK